MSRIEKLLTSMSDRQEAMEERMAKVETSGEKPVKKEEEVERSPLPRARETTAAGAQHVAQGPKVDPPNKFSGKEEEWRMFSLKMRSFYGNYLEGQMGEWMDCVRDNRERDCRVEALGSEARKPAEMLYQGLVSFCEGNAFTIVENAGEGEGLEAWRRLYQRYDIQTRQSRVSQLMRLLGTEVDMDDALNNKAQFERDWQRWESRLKKDFNELMNDLKIGILLKGMSESTAKSQLLLESEKCDTYDVFSDKFESIVRASRTGTVHKTVEQLQAQLEALKSKGGGKGGFEGKCNNCGKSGHKKSECFLPGGGAHKPGKGGGKGDGPKGKGKGKGGEGKKACFECGMTNHVAKECRSSAEKRKKYKDSLKKGPGRNAQEFEQGPPRGNEEYLGDLCPLDSDTKKDRVDQSDRTITFNVDSGASKTVVKRNHRAVRGYKIHKDEQTGVPYNTAGKQQIKDEGCRVLQTKQEPREKAWRLNTRVADVRNSLLSPSEMAKRGHDILLRNEDGYAIHRETGKTHKFDRTTGGWKFTVELEAPENANKVWKAQKLAELKSETEDWKAKASAVLKEMLGMAMKSDDKISGRAVQGFEEAFARIAAAHDGGKDPTIYPFARQQ